MAFTKVLGPGIHTQANILSHNINSSGIITATKFVGPFDGTTIGSGTTIGADGINVTGIVTATSLDINGNGDISGNLVVGGNLTANGDFTTLNTTLREVELLRVDANSSAAAGIITQRGSGDILRLYDTNTEVFKVADGGNLTVTGQTTIATTGYPQLILKDSDSNSPNDTNGISLRAANNTEYGFIGQTESGGHSLFIKTVATTNPIRLQVNSTTRFEVGNSGCYVTGVFDVASGGTSSLRGDVYIPDKLRHIGDDDTNIRFPANDTISAETAGDERLRIDSNGRLLIGSTSVRIAGDVNAQLQIEGTSYHTSSLALIANSGASAGNNSHITLAKSRGSSDGSNTILADGDSIGIIQWAASDGTDLNCVAANIRARVNGTPGSNDMPGSLEFGTTADGAAAPTERLRINSSGQISIGNNPTVAADAALHIELDGTREYLRLEGDGGTSNAYIELEAPNNRRKAIIFKSGGTRRGVIGVGDSDEAANATSLFFSASSNIAGDSPHMSIHSTGFVGINDTSNNARLIIKGNSDNGDHDCQMRIYDMDTTVGSQIPSISFWGGSTQLSYIRATNSGIKFYTSGDGSPTQKLQILNDGGIEVEGEVAASQDYPNYRPTVDWNFAAVKKLDPRIRYYRSGSASYVDEYGFVQLVGKNVPRFDHDPLTGECKGLLIEESRTNLIADSYDLTGSNWSPVNLDREAFTTDLLAPNGKYEATKIILSTDANQHYTNYSGMTKANGAERQCVSFWAKLTSSNYPILKSYITGANAFTNYSQQQFNLSTGVVTSGGSGSFTNHSAKMTQYPNGWWKCEYEATLNSSETTKRFQLLANDGSGNAGNGTDGYYIWGVQVEVGSFATSHIPTSGKTVTRGYELTTVEGTEFSDIFATDFKQFSMIADYDNDFGVGTSGQNYALVDLWGEATGYDDRIEIFRDDTSPYHLETRAFGQGNSTFANGNVTASTLAKSQRFAASWYVPDYSNTTSRRFVISMGGETADVISDGSGTTVPQVTRLGIGCNPTRHDFTPGILYFKRFMLYNRTLSDGQLQNLSAQ